MIGPGPAITAAKKQLLEQEEEEKMTTNNKVDFDGWEFKIVRAGFNKFKNPGIVRKICEEESKAGWEMLEKFDDKRIRFRRHIKNRSNDQFLDVDPYRTQYGLHEEAIVIIVALVSALIVGLIFLITRFY